jgi:hypothetical protein
MQQRGRFNAARQNSANKTSAIKASAKQNSANGTQPAACLEHALPHAV